MDYQKQFDSIESKLSELEDLIRDLKIDYYKNTCNENSKFYHELMCATDNLWRVEMDLHSAKRLTDETSINNETTKNNDDF